MASIMTLEASHHALPNGAMRVGDGAMVWL